MSPYYIKGDMLQWYILSEKAVIHFTVYQIIKVSYTSFTRRDTM